ncbi:YggS family pyridoxal phosphate-dependent enzyme [Reichenbachiella versicolor]|uniref:YggS family pyridoxal phosphate-dependent enzyme n=1 Tax=Reichenbachiella versicolor TaxID=1821036 RepID=UPI000D6E606F|nr:YggS family pyridoxal phosphate-dependent enzyme [Reichenbachiella versicolor]
MTPDIEKNLASILSSIPENVQLVAVSKTKPNEVLKKAYDAGQRIFGENKVQELVSKHESLPKDIEWHYIGHLQRNKVKYIAPFVSLIHAVDSDRLLKEINKEGKKNDRVIDCLIQVHIAQEETKFGLTTEELSTIFDIEILNTLSNVRIVGLMGMATNTSDKDQVAKEFSSLKAIYDQYQNSLSHSQLDLKTLSMGMSGDYQIAIKNGSNMIRVGSSIFGARNYKV